MSSTITDTITLTGSTCYTSSPCVVSLNTGLGSNITYGGSSTYTNSTINWHTPTTTSLTNSNGSPLISIAAESDVVQVAKKATLQVDGNIVVNGIDLETRIRTIEEVLNIPTRDVTMEDKYPKLKELYDEYMRELAKYRTWDSIKGEE